MAEFSSKFSIGDEVEFVPMNVQSTTMCIEPEWLCGTITAVRFTKAKVDDYHGHSSNVKEFSLLGIPEENV